MITVVQSIADSLRRFVDSETGPVTSVESAPYPSFWRRMLWHSVAPLHERWIPQEGKLQVLKYAGGGWSRDREESQCKAVTEAVERWALRFYTLNAPADAALDVDPTSNGFAALPVALGEERLVSGAYCEAIERWALARIWDEGDFPMRALTPNDAAANVLLPASLGESRYFETVLKPATSQLAGADRLRFVLCLIKTDTGGVLPGSACGIDPQQTLVRAACEARIHVNAFKRLRSMSNVELSNLTERRLRHFAEQPNGFDMVERHLSVSDSPPVIGAPPSTFSRRLRGEWEPEIAVHRVMVEQSRHLHEGGLERFII
jgi:hypothetical protein